MKKVLSVFLVLGLLLSVGFASDPITKIPKKSASQNFVESIDSYLHYELINPAASKELKEQIQFFLNEREKTKSFKFDLMPNGKVFITSGKAILKIENENFNNSISSERFIQGDVIGPEPVMLPPGVEPSGGGGSLPGDFGFSNADVPGPETICQKIRDEISHSFKWVCKQIPTGESSTGGPAYGAYHNPVSRCLSGK